MVMCKSKYKAELLRLKCERFKEAFEWIRDRELSISLAEYITMHADIEVMARMREPEYNWGVGRYLKIKDADALLAELRSTKDFLVKTFICKNPAITLDTFKDKTNADIAWSMYGFSQNRNVTIETVLAHPKIKWDANGLTLNPNMTYDIIKAHPEISWNMQILCLNRNITPEIVMANPREAWCLDYLFDNSNFTYDFIGASVGVIPWDSLHLEFFDSYLMTKQEWPNVEYDPYLMSMDPRATFEYVAKNKEKPWDFKILFKKRDFFKICEKDLQRRYYAANKIAAKFKEANANPEYTLCRRRLEREFSEITSDDI